MKRKEMPLKDHWEEILVYPSKCSWHPNIHGTCTHNFPISNYHCPDCDFCMACGGLDLPIFGRYLELMTRIKKENSTVTYLYGKPNAS